MRNRLQGGRASLWLLITLLGCRDPGAESGHRHDDFESSVQSVLMGGQIRGGSLPARTVQLTYDDGPDEHTLELARYLNENGIQATFFINGRRLCKTFGADGVCAVPQETRACNNGQAQAPVKTPKYYPESVLDELIKLGHRLGNHTQDHCRLNSQRNADDLVWELKATQEILDRHVCDGLYPFRAPYGEWSAATATRANGMMDFAKLTGPFNWDIDGGDWECWQEGRSPATCADGYLRILEGRPSKNGIFLMHDRPEFNVASAAPLEMTKILVPKLKAAGYSFATLEDVLRIPRKPVGGVSCMVVEPPATDAGIIADAKPNADVAVAETASPVDSSLLDAAAGAGGGGNGGAGASGANTGMAGAGAGSGGQSGSGGRTATGGRSGSGGSTASPSSPAVTSGESGGCGVSPRGSGSTSGVFTILALAVGGGLLRSRRRRFLPDA